MMGLKPFWMFHCMHKHLWSEAGKLCQAAWSREAAGKIKEPSEKQKVVTHYTRKPSRKMHLLCLHMAIFKHWQQQPGLQCGVSDRRDYWKFQSYHNSTNPHRSKPQKLSWVGIFTCLLSPTAFSLKKRLNKKKPFWFYFKAVAILSPSYFEVKIEMFTFFPPLKESSIKTWSSFTHNIGARNLHLPSRRTQREWHPIHNSWVHVNWR